MTICTRISVLTIVALTAWTAQANAKQFQAGTTSFALCQAPVTKAYKIQPGFCPRQLVMLLPQGVPSDGSSDCCGPYGIPPIFASGNNVVIRQSPEMHVRITKFLRDMGALVPPTVGTP